MSASETDRRRFDYQHFGAAGERKLALALQEQLHRSGKAWVSVAPVGGEHVLRCSPTQVLVVCSHMFGVTTETNLWRDRCVLANPELTLEHCEALLDSLDTSFSTLLA